jgi:hypothetical protein
MDGKPEGCFAERKHHKPRQGVVANTLNFFRNGAVGFIDWLDVSSLARKTFTVKFGCLRELALECVNLLWIHSER